MKRTHSISSFFAKKTVSTNIHSDISKHVNDSQLSETEPLFFDTTNEDELSSLTCTDFLDMSLLNYTSNFLINCRMPNCTIVVQTASDLFEHEIQPNSHGNC